MAKAAKALTNNYDGLTIDRYVKQVTALWDDLDSATGNHLNKTGKIRKSIAGVLEEAKAAGIPKFAMRPLLKLEMHKRQMTKIMDDLESEHKAELKQIAQARQDRVQMNLFGWIELSATEKKEIAAARKKKFKGVSGDDLTAAAKAAGEGDIDATAGNA